MAAFKAKAAPQAASTEESKQQQQAADPIEDPYDAFITPISAHNIVPAHSPMRQYSPSLEAQAAALLDVPALPLDMSSPSRPDHSTASDPETPPPELPPSGKRGSVTLSNISTSSSADSPHAVDHVELSSSPPVGLVLQYASDGETGPSSSRRSAAPRVPPRSHTKGKSTDDAQSWAEAEQIQKARAIEKELAATRRRQQQQQQEQDRRAREAYQTPPRAAPPASASSAGAGVSPLSARSRGAGGLGSESARGHSTGDGASAAAVLNALKRKQELARRGAAGAGSGSQTSRSGPSSNPYAASSSSSSSGPARAADAPLTARGFLTARGGRAQGAYDSYAGAAADYEEVRSQSNMIAHPPFLIVRHSGSLTLHSCLFFACWLRTMTMESQAAPLHAAEVHPCRNSSDALMQHPTRADPPLLLLPLPLHPRAARCPTSASARLPSARRSCAFARPTRSMRSPSRPRPSRKAARCRLRADLLQPSRKRRTAQRRAARKKRAGPTKGATAARIQHASSCDPESISFISIDASLLKETKMFDCIRRSPARVAD